MKTDYWLCGWRVHSEIPIPDLIPWLGDDRPADLTIGIGPVQDRLDDPIFDGPMVQISRDGTCRVAVEKIAAYLIDSAGLRVTIAPALPLSAPAIRMLLLGHVFGILCHKRHLLPLHASCALIDGHAVAFAGQSGIGKSTLAAAFFKRGCTLLADDVTAVDLDAPGGPVVRPAIPQLKIWRDVMAALKLPIEGLERSRAELERYHLPLDAAFTHVPRPLAAVYHLRLVTNQRHATVTRRRGLAASTDLFSDVYRHSLGSTLHGANRLFAAVTRLCAKVPTYVLARSHELSALDGLVDDLVARHSSAAATA